MKRQLSLASVDVCVDGQASVSLMSFFFFFGFGIVFLFEEVLQSAYIFAFICTVQKQS